MNTHAETVRRYAIHLAGCQMLATHRPHELVCTCGRDAALDALSARLAALEETLRACLRYDGHLADCPQDGICEATCQDARVLAAAGRPTHTSYGQGTESEGSSHSI